MIFAKFNKNTDIKADNPGSGIFRSSLSEVLKKILVLFSNSKKIYLVTLATF